MTQQWDPNSYANNFGFIATLGEPLLELLDPQAGERVLDLGCGDGALTAKIAATGCGVIGIDSSQEQIEAALEKGLKASVADAHALAFDNEFHAVVSNAALHWMKKPRDVLAGVHKALRPGGRFVGEMGGAGNVQRIVDAIEALLIEHGRDPRAVNPWYFPTEVAYSKLLLNAGFQINSIASFARPTKLDVDITTWLQSFTMSFFHGFDRQTQDDILTKIKEQLRDDLCDEQGIWHIDYVRLRFSSVKPSR